MIESSQNEPLTPRPRENIATTGLGILMRFGVFALLACSVLLWGCGATSNERGEQAVESGSVREQLESLLSADQLSKVILIDKETPLPTTVAIGILVVDGNFYEEAGPSDVEYLRSQAQAGVPIVFVGEGFNSFCKDTGVGYETIEYEGDNGQRATLRIAASALKLYPGQTEISFPRHAEIRIADNSTDLTEAIMSALEWAEGVMGEGLPLGVRAQIPATEESIPSSYPSHWDWYAHYEFATADDWKNHGQLNIRRTWYRVPDGKGISPYDPRLLKVSMDIVPGALAYNSGWKNSGTWAIVDVNEMEDGWHLVNYGPTTVYDTDRAQAVEWDYEIRDVVVKDMSDMSEERAYWWHDIDESAETGRTAYQHRPGLVYTCNGEKAGSLLQRYRAEFAKKTFSSWEHWKSDWINVVTSEASSPIYYSGK